MRYNRRVKRLERYLKYKHDPITFAEQLDDGRYMLQSGQVVTKEQLSEIDGLVITTIWINDKSDIERY